MPSSRLGAGGPHSSQSVPAPTTLQDQTAQLALAVDELIGLRQDVGEQVNALVSQVDRSVNNYDAWTLRLQAIGQAIGAWLPWLVIGIPLVTYIGPKLGWHATAAVGKLVMKKKPQRTQSAQS